VGGGGIEVDRDVFEYKREFWKINGSNFERLPELPFTSFRSLAFELNGQLFLAGGSGVGTRGIKKFNPATKAWSTLNSAPIDLDYSLAFFLYQNKAYFIANEGNIWEYEPNSDSWKILTTYPSSRGNGFGMAQVLGDKVYIGLYRRTDRLWELDLETLTWKTKNNIPGLPQSVNVGIYTFNGQIYILRAPEVSVGGNLPMELYRFEPDGI
jgi:N-acetylneuraminic acid mutarotase